MWVARALASNTVRSLLCSRGPPLPTCAWFTTRRGEHAATSGWRIQLVQRVPREHTASRHHRHEVVTTCWRHGIASSALPRKTRVELPLIACGVCRLSQVDCEDSECDGQRDGGGGALQRHSRRGSFSPPQSSSLLNTGWPRTAFARYFVHNGCFGLL
jgi:hypothetical protein